MSKEKSISELRKEIKQRFMALSEEEKNIIRENKNTPYGIVLKKVLGDELLLGLRTADGKQLLNKGGRVGYSTGSIVKGVLLTAKTLSELKPEYLKKLSRLEGYLGSINMEGKGGREAAKKTIEKIDNLKQEYKALEKDLSEKEQLDKFDTTDRSKNARGGVAYLMGL